MSGHFDVIIVGAGLSGIGAAVHLQRDCPGRSYAILEGRAASGGTWDLFRYPGIRSDSDMYTLGYSFKPWREAKAIADGPAILSYVRETAAEHGIEQHIRYGHQVKHAAWSSATARWTVTAEVDGEAVELTCSFLFMCSGYYSYAEGHRPEFPGEATFAGRMVHPQFWPADLDYAGKRVVVIGSGATAVTLVPEMARTAAHVTMLQRSPTYVVTRPAKDRIADWLRDHLPARLAYSLVRLKNVSLGMFFYRMTRTKPAKVKARLIGEVQKHLGPDYDVGTHFTPRYNPWDQRLCLVPDADLFESIKAGTSSVVTDHIERFTGTGIRLRSGAELPAEVIVVATGLKLVALGGMTLSVDGAAIDPSQRLSYKGMMLSDVPNLAVSFGYINASWTLRSDLIAMYVGRLLNHMARRGLDTATPRPGPEDVAVCVTMGLTSGYVERAADVLPKQGARRPWRVVPNYAVDLMELKYGRIDDGTMIFARAQAPAQPRELAPA